MPEEQAPACPPQAAQRESQPLRFCRDCRWADLIPASLWFGDLSACCHPKASKPALINMVTGQITPQRDMCSTQRASADSTICGIAGQWWEPKERPDLTRPKRLGHDYDPFR